MVNPVVAAAVGITMFGETFRYGTAGTLLALGCGVVAAGGLILLTTERLGDEVRAERTEVDVTVTAADRESLALEELLAGLPRRTAEVPDADDAIGLDKRVVVPAPFLGRSAADEDDAAPGLPLRPFDDELYVPRALLDRHRDRVKS